MTRKKLLILKDNYENELQEAYSISQEKEIIITKAKLELIELLLK